MIINTPWYDYETMTTNRYQLQRYYITLIFQNNLAKKMQRVVIVSAFQYYYERNGVLLFLFSFWGEIH